MILNGEKCKAKPEGQSRYLAVKKLSALLREIASKYYGGLYCLYCLPSFRTKNKLKSHKKVCENKLVCNIVMPSEGNKILESNQY